MLRGLASCLMLLVSCQICPSPLHGEYFHSITAGALSPTTSHCVQCVRLFRSNNSHPNPTTLNTNNNTKKINAWNVAAESGASTRKIRPKNKNTKPKRKKNAIHFLSPYLIMNTISIYSMLKFRTRIYNTCTCV